MRPPGATLYLKGNIRQLEIDLQRVRSQDPGTSRAQGPIVLPEARLSGEGLRRSRRVMGQDPRVYLEWPVSSPIAIGPPFKSLDMSSPVAKDYNFSTLPYTSKWLATSLQQLPLEKIENIRSQLATKAPPTLSPTPSITPPPLPQNAITDIQCRLAEIPDLELQSRLEKYERFCATKGFRWSWKPKTSKPRRGHLCATWDSSWTWKTKPLPSSKRVIMSLHDCSGGRMIPEEYWQFNDRDDVVMVKTSEGTGSVEIPKRRSRRIMERERPTTGTHQRIRKSKRQPRQR